MIVDTYSYVKTLLYTFLVFTRVNLVYTNKHQPIDLSKLPTIRLNCNP